MRKPRVRRLTGVRMYRFIFPKMSDGLRDFTLDDVIVTAKTKKEAKKRAAVHLQKKMGAAGNAMTPEQAVEIAKITEAIDCGEITVIGRWPKKNKKFELDEPPGEPHPLDC